ncbi:MAG: nuclear transport factor 2 family protein, partial [Pseudonocardia sp.]|nr:nuclear transport factor 2 family protein [Pseudonocardia sp.]
QALAFPGSAESPEALRAAAAALRDAVAGTGAALADIALTLGAGRTAFPHRATVVSGDRAELVDALDALARDVDHPALRRGSAATPAPGGDLLAVAFTECGTAATRAVLGAVPAFAATHDAVTARLAMHLGRPVDPAGDPALDAHATWIAAAAALAALGIVPDIVVGTGAGELVAAEVGGLLDPDDAAALAVAAATGRPAGPTTPRLPRVPCLTAAGTDIDPGHPATPPAAPSPGPAAVTVTVTADGVHVAGIARPAGLAGLVADTWRSGVPLDWAAVLAGHGARVTDLPTHAFRNRPFWLGATSEDVPVDQRVEPDENARKAVVTEYYRRLNAGDLDGVVAMFAEDGRIEDPLGQSPAQGHEALRRFFEVTIMQADIRDRIGPMVAAHDGRHVAASVTADMINVQDPDGGRVEIEAIMTFQVDGRGRITEARTFWGASDVTFAPAPVPALDGVQGRL